LNEREILAYLEREPALRIDMIEAIRRGRAEILYTAPDAVLLKTRGRLMLLCADTVEAGVKALEHRDPQCRGIVAHNEASRDAVTAVMPSFSHISPCWQAYYAGKELRPVPDVCEIRPFRKEDIPFLMEHYDVIRSPEYFAERIDENELFAGYRDGTLCAFIGFHDDGSGGMLEVLPEFRRLGIGSALEAFLHNEALKRGWTPYGQIFVGNEPSRKLQQSLGLVISDGEIYWMHEETE
jgi:tRNA (guanine37-N1)-methyltransferase